VHPAAHKSGGRIIVEDRLPSCSAGLEAEVVGETGSGLRESDQAGPIGPGAQIGIRCRKCRGGLDAGCSQRVSAWLSEQGPSRIGARMGRRRSRI